MKLEELFGNLTDEQKEKAKACKNVEEFKAFIGDEGIELNDEQLEALSGGSVWDGPSNCDKCTPDCMPYWW